MSSSNGKQAETTIAFDTWPLASRFRNTGIYVYARRLLSRFRDIAGDRSVEFRPLICEALANDANRFEAGPGFEPYQTNLMRVGRMWLNGGACVSAWRSKADVLFCPSGTTLPVKPFVPVVATIHDVTPVIFPEFANGDAPALRSAFARTAKSSRAIITDSICSKQDLIRIFHVPDSRVNVVYLGCDDTIFNESAPDQEQRAALLGKFAIDKPFIFHHGMIQPRKNLKRLIEAYRLVLSRNRNLDLDLVLAGDLGWQYQETLAAAKSGEGPGRVVLTSSVADPDLSIFLKTATLVVVPSLYEGFCLPLVEAMACGAPTICSGSSCLPEVSGGVLRYFDPLSVEEMSVCMEETLENSDLRASLSSKGKERASSFTWQRCAEETLTVLKSAAHS